MTEVAEATEVVTIEGLTQTDIAEIGNMSVQSLKTALAQEVQVTSVSMLRIALMWRELENRGEDLSELKGGALFEFIPHVARGNLLPSTVVHFAGNKRLLRAITFLGHDIQRKLISGESVPIVNIDQKGSPRVRHLPAAHIPQNLIGIAFAGKDVRSIEDQKKIALVKFTRTQISKTKYIKQGAPILVVVERDKNRIKVANLELDLDKMLVSLQEAGFTVS